MTLQKANILNMLIKLIKCLTLFTCARVSDWPIWVHNCVYIFPSVEFSFNVLTLYTLKNVRRKALITCFKIFAFFKAVYIFSQYRNKISIKYDAVKTHC